MPSVLHEERVKLLRALAAVFGFTRMLRGGFPEGEHPDVLLTGSQPLGIFVGDAKDSEHPSFSATVNRLRRYMRWFRAAGSQGRTCVFAISFGRVSDALEWKALLDQLARDAGFAKVSFSLEFLPNSHYVIWWSTTKRDAHPSA